MRRADGTFRDTVVFSLLKDEWPGVRTRLLARLDGA
jgi:RimJ/RimL family protein N-acetyltransferase